MNIKSLNIIGLITSIVLLGLTYYYMGEVDYLRWWNNGGDSRLINSSSDKIGDLTFKIGIYSILFFSVLAYLFFKNKTLMPLKTLSRLSTVGLVLTSLIFIYNIIMMLTPAHISFDEVGYAWLLYGVLSSIIFIIFILQKNLIPMTSKSDDIIDDLEFE